MSPTPSNAEDFNVLPVWLNRKYLEDAIRFYTKYNKIKILKFDIIPAVAKGENYASVMSRIRLEYVSENDDESQNVSYVLKSSFETGGTDLMRKTFESYKVFECEMGFYDSIIPKLKAILQTVECNDSLVPDTIKIDYKRNCILFEDLSVRNYVMAGRKDGLNIKHAKLFLKKVAKIHAASIIQNEMTPDIFKTFDRGVFNKHTDLLSTAFVGNLEACGQAVSNWKGFEHYGEKLLKLKSKVMEYGEKIFEPKDNQLNALIHGDFKVNNVMFKYNNDNEPIDAVLIDFQYSCWASPTIDLHYFFHTSLSDDVKHNSLDELVQFYYMDLANTLRMLKFGGTIPTLKEFWLQYMEKSFYAVVSACIIHPLLIIENTENADASTALDDGEQSNNFRQLLYSNEKVVNNLKNWLPIFDRHGLLDID